MPEGLVVEQMVLCEPYLRESITTDLLMTIEAKCLAISRHILTTQEWSKFEYEMHKPQRHDSSLNLILE